MRAINLLFDVLDSLLLFCLQQFHYRSSSSILFTTVSLCKAFVKAMLTSPSCDANGYSNTFGNSDFTSLNGLNRGPATEAAKLMKEAENFLAAYGHRIGSTCIDKLLSTLEVRLVMLTHKKTCSHRASFSSLQQVAATFYADAKDKDGLLPKWNMVTEEIAKAPKSKIAVLRETGDIVNQSILAEKGFELGTSLVHVESGNIFKLTAFNADEITVTLKLEEKVENGKVKTPLTVSRTELLIGQAWHVSNATRIQWHESKLSSPTDYFDLKASILTGLIKQAMAVEFNKSSHDLDCKMSTSSNDVKVHANKHFKTGALKLVGLTNNIHVCAADKVMLAAMKPIGSGKDWKAYARSSNSPLAGKVRGDFLLVIGLFGARLSRQLSTAGLLTRQWNSLYLEVNMR